MLWRGAIDWPAFLTGRSMVVAGGLAAKLVIYPIAEGSRPDKRLTNWAVVGRVGDASTPAPHKQDWSRPGPLRGSDAACAALPHSVRGRSALIEASNEFWEYPMCDRDPLPRWSIGRVTLLGRRGASDVSGRLERRLAGDPRRALPGRSAEDAEHPVHALWPYEQARLPMTAEIVRRIAAAGPKASSTRSKRARRTASPISTTCCRSSSARPSCAAMRRRPALPASRSTRRRKPTPRLRGTSIRTLASVGSVARLPPETATPAAAGTSLRTSPTAPPRPAATAPSCCGSPRTDRRACASASPRRSTSRSGRTC